MCLTWVYDINQSQSLSMIPMQCKNQNVNIDILSAKTYIFAYENWHMYSKISKVNLNATKKNSENDLSANLSLQPCAKKCYTAKKTHLEYIISNTFTTKSLI